MNKNHYVLGQLIKKGKIIFPEPRHNIPMSDELKDIVRRLLDKNPKTRLGSNGDADEIVNHPWFRNFDWNSLMAKTMTSKYKPEPKEIMEMQ